MKYRYFNWRHRALHLWYNCHGLAGDTAVLIGFGTLTVKLFSHEQHVTIIMIAMHFLVIVAVTSFCNYNCMAEPQTCQVRMGQTR